MHSRNKCPECNKKLKVNETRLRSLLKAAGFRIFETLVDTLFLRLFIESLVLSFLIAISIEFLCFLSYFMWERIWNKIPFGREIKMEKSKNE